jgi:hypothetical protein
MENGTIEIHFDLGKTSSLKGMSLLGRTVDGPRVCCKKKRFGWAAKGPVPKQEK